MSDSKPSKEAMIIRLKGKGKTRAQICQLLKVGPHRVAHACSSFAETGIIPEPLPRGPRRKVTKAIPDFIDIRTLHTAHVSSARSTGQIHDRFHVLLHPSTVAFKRHTLGFRYRPPRHVQALKPHHIAARVEFCRNLLANPGWLPLIHFSDESRFVLGDDKPWVWYRPGEDNESANRSTDKFPPSVMIFAVIGPNYRLFGVAVSNSTLLE